MAWGPLGHELVCDIAWRSMSGETKKEVKQLLKLSPYKTFAESCTHADRIRSDPKMSGLKPYHYINIPRGAPVVKRSNCGFSGCVLSAIDKYSAALSNSDSPLERLDALMYVGHFVGDIHQPLHVSYSDDLGGNRTSVKFFDKDSNLHQVWDSDILNHNNDKTWREMGNELAAKHLRKDNGDNPQIKQGTPLEWANESLRITISAYSKLPEDKTIGQAYYDHFYPIVIQRIVQGGERLGALLNTLVASYNQGLAATNKDNRQMPLQIGGDYYADIKPSMTGAQLHQALHKLIKSHKQLTYKEVWKALEYTDEDPANTNNVILLYTQRSHPKKERVRNGSGPNAWNREHVWAKSHGFPNKGDPRYTDIHHLRPSDNKVNADRGQKDFDKGGLRYVKAPGAFLDADSFEPPNIVKGDVARMMFYMATAYKDSLQLVNEDSSKGEPRFGYLCTLLVWHKTDPVSPWEQRRNNRIHEIQANRNPFIDHPEHAESIWGSQCN